MRCLLYMWTSDSSIPAAPRAQLATSFEPLGLGPAGVVSVESNAHDHRCTAWSSLESTGVRQPIPHSARIPVAGVNRDARIGALNPNAPEVQPLAVPRWLQDRRLVAGNEGLSGRSWTAAGGMRS